MSNKADRHAVQMVKTGMSGLAAAVVDLAAMVALVEVVGVQVAIAAFLSAACGAGVGFVLSKYWAFGDRTRIDSRRAMSRLTSQLGRYALVSLGTAVFVGGLVQLLAVGVGVPYVAAKLAAAIAVFAAWSYPAQARLVFPRTALSRA